MTSSTLYDLTRIAAMPGTAGAGSAPRLEAPQAPLPPAPIAKPRKAKKKAPNPDAVKAAKDRAHAALDKASTALVTCSTVALRLSEAFGVKKLNDLDVVKMELPAEIAPRVLCDGDVMTVGGVKHEFFPDGGTTMFEGIKVRTGEWRPVAKEPERILGKRATLLALDEAINGRRAR